MGQIDEWMNWAKAQATERANAKPKVIQIVGARGAIYILRSDGTVWGWDGDTVDWRQLKLPGEGDAT